MLSTLPQFGMYSNACGVAEWTYTEMKHEERVCCSRGGTRTFRLTSRKVVKHNNKHQH